ncbi:MAG: hypothetical protein IJ275_05095 [Ruminococcus sp.]|nr:hypothetical protein [Ruminococcus sp.]
MKKLISLLLCAVMLFGCATVSAFATEKDVQLSVKEAVEQYEAENSVKVNTNRYYFLMPNGTNGNMGTDDTAEYYKEFAPSWYNEYTTGDAGVYWWDTGKLDPAVWTGYKMEKDECESIFYADVPDFVETLIFNNNVNGGMDMEDPIYYNAYQSTNLIVSDYYYDESPYYPYGLDDFDDMIFVVDPKLNSSFESNRPVFGGEWFYYYGDGCYGISEHNDPKNCIRDDHNHNEDYYTVAGSWKLCGTEYNPYEKINRMLYDPETGVYTKIYVNVTKGEHELCLTKNGAIEDALKDATACTVNITKKDAVVIVTYDGEDMKVEVKEQLSAKEALEKYEAQTGEIVETNRYYFLMPNGENGIKDKDDTLETYSQYADSWISRYSDEPVVYWWNSEIIKPEWMGYTMEKGDCDGVFYADVPKAVTTILYNNNIDYGRRLGENELFSACQTINIPCEYYDAGESESYPDGVESFDEMIFVVSPNDVTMGWMPAYPQYFSGEWYYYYGGGCFGTVKDGSYSDCLRDDHTHTRIVDNKICFDANTTKWEDTSKIYCHIYDDDGNYFYDWCSNSEKCIDTNGDGVWTYDLTRANIILEDDKTYHVIFSNGLRGQTMSLQFKTLSIGKTAYCTGMYLDSDKDFYYPEISWKDTTAPTDSYLGDVDNDGEVNVLDATLIQLHIAQLSQLSKTQLMSADTDKNGDVNILDATTVQLYLAKLIEKL